MNSSEFFNKINYLRKSRSFFSNSFFSKAQLLEFFAGGNVQIEALEDILLLIIDEKKFKRLYFFAVDFLSLKKIPELISSFKPVIADIIVRNEKSVRTIEALEDAGFTQYRKFIRMVCVSPPKIELSTSNYVEISRKEMAEEIETLLKNEFDPLISHLPKSSEILSALEKSEISIVRKDGRLAGLAYFQKIAAGNYLLRYFLVAPDYRGQGIGISLIGKNFTNNEINSKYTLWVDTANPAVKLYEKLNFVPDGLEDYIMIIR